MIVVHLLVVSGVSNGSGLLLVSLLHILLPMLNYVVVEMVMG